MNATANRIDRNSQMRREFRVILASKIVQRQCLTVDRGKLRQLATQESIFIGIFCLLSGANDGRRRLCCGKSGASIAVKLPKMATRDQQTGIGRHAHNPPSSMVVTIAITNDKSISVVTNEQKGLLHDIFRERIIPGHAHGQALNIRPHLRDEHRPRLSVFLLRQTPKRPQHAIRFTAGFVGHRIPHRELSFAGQSDGQGCGHDDLTGARVTLTCRRAVRQRSQPTKAYTGAFDISRAGAEARRRL